MKIAIWYNQPSGGAKRALYHHVRGLVERGHIVEVWRPDVFPDDYLPLGGMVKEHVKVFPWKPSEPKSEVQELLYRARRAPNTKRAMERHCAECAEEINRGGFDLLFAPSCAMVTAPPIGRFVEIPSVLYLQEPCRSFYEAFPSLPWLALPPEGLRGPRLWRETLAARGRANLARFQAREEQKNACSFDQVLVNSYFSRESVLRAYGLDARVCYLGIDTQLFRPLGLSRERFVVGMGMFRFSKGVDRALRGLATIPARERPPLIWIGNADAPVFLNGLRELASELGVRFEPRIQLSDDELVTVLNTASVMIYTSRLEPFGFAPLEANACETPVVAIAEGGVRETIQPGINGMLVGDARPEALGEAIRELLADPSGARKMGARARAHVEEQWTWIVALDSLEKAFSDLLLASR